MTGKGANTMRQNHDHNNGCDNHGYDRWEQMTPAERKYEKDHHISGDDWCKLLICFAVIYYLLQFFSMLRG